MSQETRFEERKWGYFPDVPSHQDYLYSATPDPRPLVVDLSPQFKNEVEDQKTLGSCVANSCVSALEYLIAKKNANNPNYKYPELSRLFAYYYARKASGLETVDRGSFIRDCVDQLRKVGVCEESVWPYFLSSVNTPPDEFAIDDAKANKVGNAYRVESLDDKLDCLAQGYPFAFGFMVFEDSINQAGRTGTISLPSGSRGGGHAVLAVGYDMNKQMFLIRNSWGKNWGINGYFWMPFEYLRNPSLSSDYWTIRTFGD